MLASVWIKADLVLEQLDLTTILFFSRTLSCTVLPRQHVWWKCGMGWLKKSCFQQAEPCETTVLSFLLSCLPWGHVAHLYACNSLQHCPSWPLKLCCSTKNIFCWNITLSVSRGNSWLLLKKRFLELFAVTEKKINKPNQTIHPKLTRTN